MNPEVLAIVERMAEAFGKAQVGKERIKLYAQELSEIPVDHLDAVVRVLIRTCKFFPTIAEVYVTWSDLLLGPPSPDQSLVWCLQKAKRQEADQWAAFYERPILDRPAAFRFDPKAPESYPDPVTQEAVRLFGWAELIECDPEYRPGMWRKTYAQARELVSKRVQSGAVTLPLPAGKLRALEVA